MLPLFDEYNPPAPAGDRITVGGPEYVAYYAAFHLGAGDHDKPSADGDDAVTRYRREGFRIGRLFRVLPCMKERVR